MTLHSLWLRVRALAFNRRAESDLDEELAFHLEKERRQQAAAGSSELGAALRARRRFGSVLLAKDACRDVRTVFWIEGVAQDVRVSFRSFRASPGYAATVIGAIAIGLGLNIAAFTIFNAYALRADGVRDPSSLYEFTWTIQRGTRHQFSWPRYLELSTANSAFAETVARRQTAARMNGQRAIGQLVTGNYFSMLGVDAARGRTIVPFDLAGPGREPVIVLSHSGWQRIFDQDPDIVGKRVLVGGRSCEVIGVTAEDFSGLDVLPPDFWAPLTLGGHIDRGLDIFGPTAQGGLTVIGRLKPEMTETAAREALLAWGRAATSDGPERERVRSVVLTPRATPMGLDRASYLTEVIFWPILAGFALVLALACTNVAAATLARTLTRSHEFETKLALGASRARIVRQVLIESLCLAFLAAVLGLVVAVNGIPLAQRILLNTLPAEALSYFRVQPLSPDSRVVLFALSLAIVVALLAGLAPAL